MPTRLLLIDDHAVFRQIAARVLAEEPNLEIAGEAESVETALAQLPSARPDVVILDYDLKGRNGADFVSAARDQGYKGPILMLSAAVPDAEFHLAMMRGANGLVLKEESFERLLAAIRAVAEGRVWLDRRHMEMLAAPAPNSLDLSERERQILTHVVNGLSNKEIAEALHVPETTVKSGLQSLFRKTGVRTRGSLTRVALEKHKQLLV